jgi:guanylate kinase
MLNEPLTTNAPRAAGLLIVVTGPSGTGKSTILSRWFASDPRLAFSVSHTTRPARPGEVDGRDYWFVTDATFDGMVERGEFAEWAHVHKRRYGTSRAEIDRLVRAGMDPVFDIDVVGADNLAKAYPECVRVFLLPPSLAVLEARLRGRGTESEAMIATRLDNARQEIAQASRFHYLVTNASVEEAAGTLAAIVTAERRRTSRLPDLPARLLAGEEIA